MFIAREVKRSKKEVKTINCIRMPEIVHWVILEEKTEGSNPWPGGGPRLKQINFSIRLSLPLHLRVELAPANLTTEQMLTRFWFGDWKIERSDVCICIDIERSNALALIENVQRKYPQNMCQPRRKSNKKMSNKKLPPQALLSLCEAASPRRSKLF